ncbi:MAG: DUF5009 domain-containing protein [Bacteroidaceae bacterium]|nr:DUF5009 domain-containing protein [Bacteroidaceae bacterium]
MEQKTEKQRLVSLDVLRGLTIAGMILVNNGHGPSTFAPLQHSLWNGLSIADVVFPFFLFMVGISTYISLRKYRFCRSAPVGKKILKRTILILLIGWGIYWFEGCCAGDFLPFGHLRIPGVLQRIALCYGIVSVIAITVSHKVIPWIIGGLLVAYALILSIGNGYDCHGSNVLAVVDRYLFGASHLYHKSPVDPEGVLGIIPSVAHTLLGFWCGKLIMESKELRDKMLHLMLFGFVLMMGGLLLNYGIPFNKRIWSPSFVLFTCGTASCLLAFLMYVIDEKGSKRWTPFFVSFGMNPLFLYVFSELLSIIFHDFGIGNVIYTGIAAVIADAFLASLVYAVVFVMICWLVSYPLFKRKIYIKI